MKELKKYQERVLDDLDSYNDELIHTGNPGIAYRNLWENKGVRIGFGEFPSYNDVIPGVPSVCFKVPTGGGKTLLGCSALKRIFDKMSKDKKKVVVWLVPWDTILTQTYNTLSDPSHFYHQRLVRDFSGKVEIYNKKQAIYGQNLNVSSVNEQLSIFVLSFDTFRSKSKENRKVYEANPNLAQMTALYDDKDSLIKDVDETAFVQVLNQMNPVVVIDESHNATSDLSIEMIKNLNPSYVLELTATPNLTDVETALVTKLSGLDIKCWHRIISNNGFCINGFINHYPDFVVFTKKGKIIIIETKGEQLANEDSKRKLELGELWANKAGEDKYRYYMTFLKNPMEGAYQIDKLIEIIKNL